MVTIKDIAREAEVGHPTVSLVLNGKAKQARISDKVAQRVHEVARNLGYARNEIARSMVTGRSEVIAFVASTMGSVEYTGQIQQGILTEASSHNYSIKLYRLEKDKQAEIAKTLIAQRVSGAVFHAASVEGFAIIHEELDRKRIPVAAVNLSNSGTSGLGITTDDHQGAVEAVKYLIALGHRRIVHITYANHIEYLENRRNGYLDGMKEFSDAKPLILNIPQPVGNSSEFSWFRASIKAIHAQGATAVFCSQDTIAMRVLRAAYELNIKIPANLSIIGFGDMDMGKFATVPLTTIAQPFEEMGRIAAARLIEAASRKDVEKSENIKLKTQLIIRESTTENNKGVSEK